MAAQFREIPCLGANFTHPKSKKLTPHTKWSNQQWQHNLQALLDNATDFDPCRRQQWLQNIRRAVLQERCCLNSDTCLSMAEVAGWMCDWNLQILLLEKCKLENSKYWQQLFYACWKTGARELANELIKRAMLSHPQDQDLFKIFQYLEEFSNQPPVYSHLSCDIRLECLDVHHLEEFRWQYCDPKIAQLCNLPDYGTDAQWLSWLEQQHVLNDQVTFAVMHSEWGFIGVVSLIVHDSTGLFYYWIGEDFRGRGWGPVAVQILLDWGAQVCGLDCCFARVLKSNNSSKKALDKMGFSPVKTSLECIKKTECFYYRGQQQPPSLVALYLQRLLKGINECGYWEPTSQTHCVLRP